jgi:predicted nucleotidyltransferase
MLDGEGGVMAPQVSLKHDQLAELCRRYRVRRLAVFGSAGREDFDPGRSDLDFLVEFEVLPPGVYADTYFGLLEALKQLYGRPVDLIEAGSVRNPYIRQEIEATQETVYAA